MKPILAELRGRRLRRTVMAYASQCQADLVDIDKAQLQRLNEAWAESLRRSPWARTLCKQLRMPARFESWAAFREAVPIQRKRDLVATIAATKQIGAERIVWRATGGTTAEPLRIPFHEDESRNAELDHWLGRCRLGIEPTDRLFLLWGHAHLFGSGLKGAIARVKRLAADRALGYTRWSAYRLTEAELVRAAEALITSGAAYVVGYSSALDRFARVNVAAARRLHALKLKAVIATAEGFPATDSRPRIAACFGCPVVMEYGSVETGPIAYERLEACGDVGGYDVFFRHHRLERGRVMGHTGAAELLVTSLYPRALPLLRYAVGDLMETGYEDDGVTRFARVIGRSNDAVATPSGALIHSEAFTHVLRDLPGISAYQIVRGEGAAARRIRYEADAALAQETLAELRRRLGLIDAGLAALEIERVDRIERSIAGKSLMVVNEV